MVELLGLTAADVTSDVFSVGVDFHGITLTKLETFILQSKYSINSRKSLTKQDIVKSELLAMNLR